MRCLDFSSQVLIALLLTLFLCASSARESALASEPALRHPTSLVNAEVFVERKGLTMRVTCFAEDLEMLQGVEPLETGFFDPDEIKDATKDHSEYLAEKLTIRDANGELLKPTISEIIDVEIPAGGLPQAN